jgi:uncharacterized protein (DUF1919 family)
VIGVYTDGDDYMFVISDTEYYDLELMYDDESEWYSLTTYDDNGSTFTSSEMIDRFSYKPTALKDVPKEVIKQIPVSVYFKIKKHENLS